MDELMASSLGVTENGKTLAEQAELRRYLEVLRERKSVLHVSLEHISTTFNEIEKLIDLDSLPLPDCVIDSYGHLKRAAKYAGAELADVTRDIDSVLAELQPEV